MGTRNENILSLLWRREVDPTGSRLCRPKTRNINQQSLSYWVESDAMRNCGAAYCPINSPRSTIAAAFSPDGTLLASTHGDHTVKLICCRTGRFLKELEGHKRTPWVVRFHPRSSQILASGSLDHTVRLWNTSTAQCVAVYDFARPIASLAFHTYGNILAVASGHKVWTWEYSKGSLPGVTTGAPATALRTKRSLRAVHFHPHGAPLLLTAEVNEADATESNPPSQATTWPLPNSPGADGGAAGANSTSHMAVVSGGIGAGGDAQVLHGDLDSNGPEPMAMDQPGGYDEGDHGGAGQAGAAGGSGPLLGGVRQWQGNIAGVGQVVSNIATTVAGSLRGAVSNGARIGRGQEGVVPGAPGAGLLAAPAMGELGGGARAEGGLGAGAMGGMMVGPGVVFPPPPPNMAAAAAAAAAANPAAAAAAAAIVGQEQPCTVKLRLWPFNEDNPSAKLENERLTIPHSVLCSEMGTHFSPCGRYLAACVACRPPPDARMDEAAAPGAPAAPALMYELRIYSLDQRSFGKVLVSRAVRAAHCLTSIQFSPTSEHLLLAYGRRHISLLRSLVADGGQIIPVYTILEVYRVRDMQLVRVLPSAEDEVNVACFHPSMGGGLAYGTKEGRLRLLRHDRNSRKEGAEGSLEDELLFREGENGVVGGGAAPAGWHANGRGVGGVGGGG